MKMYTKLAFLLMANMIMMYSATAQQKQVQHDIKGEEVSYSLKGLTMKGYVAYDAAIKTKRPGIVVVHEWWGSNEYARKRARQLAELGYIAFAADLFGDGKIAEDPKTAGEYATPFYQNPQMAKDRIEAAISKLKEYPQTDASKIGGVGYCFGGSMLLNSAKLGMDMKVVVSFHGGLAGVAGMVIVQDLFDGPTSGGRSGKSTRQSSTSRAGRSVASSVSTRTAGRNAVAAASGAFVLDSIASRTACLTSARQASPPGTTGMGQ